MAGRPRIANVNFFRHSVNQHNDRRVKTLRDKFGLEGYAIYNLMLETLAGANNLELEIDETELELLASDYGTESGRLRQILAEMVRIRLIQRNEDLYFSNELKENLQSVFDKRERERERTSEEPTEEETSKNENPITEPKEGISAAGCELSSSRQDRQDRQDVSKKESIKKKDVATAPTPAQEAKDFFSNLEKQELVIPFLVEKGLPENIARDEIAKFISCWTELTLDGKRQRWQLEDTFEVKRRFVTWLKNMQKFNARASPQFVKPSRAMDTSNPNL